MINKFCKSTIVISLIFTPILFSCASNHKNQSGIGNAELYVIQGISYGQKGQYDNAISNFDKAIEINPRFAEAYRNRGITYAMKWNTTQAISDLNKAIEINPGFAEAHKDRGDVYDKIYQYDQAISDYTKALEINPAFALAYYNRAFAYFIISDYEKSWEDVEKAKHFGFKIPPKFLENLRMHMEVMKNRKKM